MPPSGHARILFREEVAVPTLQQSQVLSVYVGEGMT